MIQRLAWRDLMSATAKVETLRGWPGNDENCIDCPKLTKISGKIVVTFDMWLNVSYVTVQLFSLFGLIYRIAYAKL